MRTSITDNTCAAVPVLNKSRERINEDAIHSNLPRPESQPGDHHASAVGNKSVRQNTRSEAVAKHLNNGGRSFFCCTANPFQALFNTDHALLLHQGRFLAPRNNRGLAGHPTRIVQTGQTFPRTFHSHGFSTLIPPTRFNHEHKHSTATLIPCSFHFHDSSMPMDFPRSRTFHGFSVIMDFPFPRIDHHNGFATHSPGPTSRHAISKPVPFCPPNHSQSLTHNFQRMTTFDPNLIRKVVMEFRPKRPPKFQELLAAKELITELRRKGASYESIAEVLVQHCLPVSKSAIAMFCHEMLGESVRSRRRPAKKRPPATVSTGVENKPAPKSNFAAAPPSPPVNLKGNEDAAARSRGPHIAKVELLPPGEQYD